MTINAGSIMTCRTITVRPDSTIPEAASALTAHDISAVPVCAEDGTLLGMLSEGDLMRPFRQKHSLPAAWWLGVLSVGDTMTQALAEYVRQDRRCARDLMTHPVITATETATPADIAELMLRHRIKRIPIERDGQLVGIVSRADLINALAMRRDTSLDWQPARAGSDKPAIVPVGERGGRLYGQADGADALDRMGSG